MRYTRVEKLNMPFLTNVREEIIRQGLTQEIVAKRSGIPIATFRSAMSRGFSRRRIVPARGIVCPISSRSTIKGGLERSIGFSRSGGPLRDLVDEFLVSIAGAAIVGQLFSKKGLVRW